MKKIFAIIIILLVGSLVVFVGCLRKTPKTSAPGSDRTESSETESAEPEISEPDVLNKADTPDGAAGILLESVSNLDRDQINELMGQYFDGQSMPDEYFCLLKPISEHISYKIGDSRVNEDTAEVDVTITSIDAQSAINSVMAGAVMHLAAMQLAGKDVSNPEKILAEYAADNIKWDDLPTIKNESTLYLVKGADGEWKADASNPKNLDFANALSGGAVGVAKSLKAYTDKYK